MAHMSVPCHEGPPATKGHFSSEPAVAGRGRYYCTSNYTSKGLSTWARARVCVDVRACMHVCHRMRVYICVSTCACVYLRGCARGNVCVCVNIIFYVIVCVRACVHACTSVSSVRAKGENHFF